MTKKDFANKKVDDFCKRFNIDRSSITNWGPYLYASGSLAVCLEYLGLLTTAEQLEYSSTRGGIEKIVTGDKEPDNIVVISTREVLDSYPDTEIINHDTRVIYGGDVKELISLLKEACTENYSVFANGVNKMYLHIDHENKTIVIDSENIG